MGHKLMYEALKAFGVITMFFNRIRDMDFRHSSALTSRLNRSVSEAAPWSRRAPCLVVRSSLCWKQTDPRE